MRYKTFAINLKSNDYRRDYILGQQEKSGLNIQIFEAVTPETITRAGIEVDTTKAMGFTGRDMMPTEIACALSHMMLWQNLLKDEEADYYLIMEDDIEIKDNIANILDSVQGDMIDFLKLSGQCKRPMRMVQDLEGRYKLVRYAFGPLDAACYMVSKKAARTLLAYCRDLKAPIDILMDRSYDHGIPVYGVMPYPTHTEFNFDESDPLCSNIGERNSDYKKDRSFATLLQVRFHRIIGGIKRKLATLRLNARHV